MSIEDAANAIVASNQGSGKGSNSGFNSTNPFALFVNSLASSATVEMFGHEPSEGIADFRAQHPVAGVVSQLGGFAIPYAGVGKLGTLPKIAGMLDKVGEADSILGSAKRNAVLFGGGVEAPRVIGSALTGGDTGETAQEAAFNTALELGFGGLGGYFRAAGKADKKALKLGANVDLKQPPQQIAQDILKSISENKVAPEDLPYANNMISNLENAIKSEKGEKYINEMDDGDAQPLNRLFKVSDLPNKSPITKKLFTEGAFDTPQELDSWETKAGLKGNIPYVQFPRFLATTDESGARAIEASIKSGGLRSVGENTLLGKEKDGLYVLAKKVEGDIGHWSKDDKWVMFKTSNPGKFSKTAQDWGDEIAKRNAWLVDKPRVADPENPLDILDEVQGLADAMPIHGFYQAVKGTGGKAVENLQKMIGLEGESESIRRLKSVFRENFAPAMYEFKSNPRAQWVFAQAKSAFQKAESLAHAMTYGDEALGKGANVYSKLMASASLSGKFGVTKAFAKIIEPLDQLQINELVAAVDKGLEGQALIDAHAKGVISKPVFDALNEIKPLDDYLIKQTQATQSAAGSKEFSPIKGHYLLPRTWKGTWRVPLKNENGRLIYIASGNTRQEALKQAERILKSPDAKGWKSSQAVTADTTDDLALALQVAAGSPEYMTAAGLKHALTKDTPRPKTFKVRTGVGGYEDSFTKQELTSKFYDNVLARNKYLAELSTNKVLGEQMAKVGIEDSQLFKELQRRIDSMAGKQGPINKVINAEIDKVFAPSLGKNSGSKIAGTINEVNHHLTLGALNLAFPVMNALTFIQNVMPRIAFTMKASDESLMKTYDWLPLIGSDKKVRGSFGALSPFKIMTQSFREMGRPDEALTKNFSKALREGVVDPKFVEEWSGSNAKQLLKLKETLRGEEPYSNFLKAASNYLPSMTEKLSRGNAFTVGHIVGRDFFKLEDEALYRFAKEFTEKTMYNYSAADRPRVFTGPLGTVFGQFKNWTAHYIYNMFEYLGEGFNYGNWSPFLWQQAGTTGLGGISASALYPVADKVNEWLTDKPLMETMYDRMGGGSGDAMTGNMVDGIYHGIPMFLGVSMSGQASDPLSDPSRTASMMFSFVQAQRAEALGKAVGQMIDNYSATGEHPINSEETRDLFISALAPKVMSRYAALTEDQGIKSLNNGNKLYAGLNVPERIMYTTGFMPKRVALQKDVNEALWKNQEEMKTKVTTYGRLWSEAEKDGDFDLMTQLQRNAMAEGVPLDSVIKSAKTQTRNREEPQMERQFKASDSLKFKSLGIVE